MLVLLLFIRSHFCFKDSKINRLHHVQYIPAFTPILLVNIILIIHFI